MKKYLLEKSKIIEKELKTIEATIETNIQPEIWEKALKEPIFYLIESGGKRLRPVLTCLITDIFEVKNSETTKLALISEILHNATLMIDDIEDQSELRRGKICSHHKFGTSVTLNAGNFWYFWPTKLISSSQISKQQKDVLLEKLITEMTRLHQGQAMDIYWAKNKIYDISLEDYNLMSIYKTGSMLTLALLIGGIIANLSDNKLDKLANLARKMGLAFQMRDDILDIVATDQQWGKKKDQDLHEGKLTSLVVKTLELANNDDKKILIELLSKEKKTDSDIGKIKAIFETYDTINLIQKDALKLVEEIKKSGTQIMPDNEYRKIFFEITDYLANREK